jgi:hypothetical protein
MTARRTRQMLVLILVVCGLQGCLVGTVIDVAAETVEAGIGITGAAAGAVVGVVTPDGDEGESDSGEDDD